MLAATAAARVAEVRGVSLEEVDRITTGNCQRLFGWPASVHRGGIHGGMEGTE